jgi:hypothetical protein
VLCSSIDDDSSQQWLVRSIYVTGNPRRADNTDKERWVSKWWDTQIMQFKRDWVLRIKYRQVGRIEEMGQRGMFS